MPGTAPAMGVRFGGFGEITPRSVIGVNANAGRPGNELFAGVVNGLLVVRSLLSKQLISTSSLASAAFTSSQLIAAWADAETKKQSAAAMPQILTSMKPSPCLREQDAAFIRAAQ